jgi:hypothetical protein
MPNYILTLEDEVESVSFISDGANTYYLLDGTLEISSPKIKDERVTTKYSLRRDISAVKYEDRTISFTYQIRGATPEAIADSANKIYRMLGRATSQIGIDGGLHSGVYGFNSSTLDGVITGDSGLTLTIRYGDAGSGTVTNEVNQTSANDRVFVFRVVSGEQNIQNPMSVTGTASKNNLYILSEVQIELECEPFALGQPRLVATATNLQTQPYPVGSFGNTNRIVIPAASIPGSVEALTRITTTLSGNGVIIARDVGRSLLNTPSPVRKSNGNSVEQIIPVGIVESATATFYEIKVIAVNPFQYQTRINGGAYSATVTPTAWTSYAVDGSISLVSTTSNMTGLVAVNDVLNFASHQAYILSNNTYDVYSSLSSNPSTGTMSIVSKTVLVQPGTTGKYRVLASLTSGGTMVSDYEIKTQYSISGASGGLIMSVGASETGWIRAPVGAGAWMADLGVIDLTPSGTRGTTHPGASMFVNIATQLRLMRPPLAGATLYVGCLHLVPCSDDFSYVRAGWPLADDTGIQVYSNFDTRGPYMIRAIKDYRAPNSYPNLYNGILPIDESHDGEIITLVPGVTNTLLIVPLSGGSSSDFRNKVSSASLTTGNVTVAIRPRYHFVG